MPMTLFTVSDDRRQYCLLHAFQHSALEMIVRAEAEKETWKHML